MQQNPFRRIREQAGRTQAEMALRLGVPIGAVLAGEHGLSEHPRRLLDAFARAGHDAEQIAVEYRAWRAAQVGPKVPA